MNRCSFREWIPILPWPVWPRAGQCRLGQKTVVGSMTVLLLAVHGNIARMQYVWTPFSLHLHCTTIGCRAIDCGDWDRYEPFSQCQASRLVGGDVPGQL